MSLLNVTVKEIGANNEGLEVTFQCSKELLKDFNGWMPLDTAQEFGEWLLKEVTKALKKQHTRV